MSYMVRRRLEKEILCFEIAGSIYSHLDSIARCVRYSIAESRTQRLLLDLRNVIGHPTTAEVFIHVLKYPPMHQINCALIHPEHGRDFLALYATLMRHRGHRIELFASIQDGLVWLKRSREFHMGVKEGTTNTLRRLYQSMLDACSLRAKA